MLADASPSALLAPAPSWKMPAQPHSLHLFRCRLCWQMLAPPHSLHRLLLASASPQVFPDARSPLRTLHWLLIRACWQMLAPALHCEHLSAASSDMCACAQRLEIGALGTNNYSRVRQCSHRSRSSVSGPGLAPLRALCSTADTFASDVSDENDDACGQCLRDGKLLCFFVIKKKKRFGSKSKKGIAKEGSHGCI